VSHNSITLDSGVDHLADNLLVSSSNNKSVLLGIVFILVLNDETLASVVIGFTLSSTAIFGLVSLRVCLVLKDFNESHM